MITQIKVTVQRCNDLPDSSFRITKIIGAMEVLIPRTDNMNAQTETFAIGDYIEKRETLRRLCAALKYDVTVLAPKE